MEQYDFEVLEGAKRPAVVNGLIIPNDRTMWSCIGQLAKRLNKPGTMILVKNSAGKIVVMVGVATAIQLRAEIVSNVPSM